MTGDGDRGGTTTRKVFNVSFFLDLHAVTSPGVWLCPNGKVTVRVSLFGVYETTKKLSPVFPLLFHERFHFRKTFRKAGSLQLLERRLARNPLCLELTQCPVGTARTVRLAAFRARLGDLLLPPCGAELKLMFAPDKAYPGIIAPLAEVSVRLAVEESDLPGSQLARPVTICSKPAGPRPEPPKPRPRQRSVCHTKHNIYCSCFSQETKDRRRKHLPANKRMSAELGPGKRAPTKFPAHIRSHKNFGDSLYRSLKSESIIETSDVETSDTKKPEANSGIGRNRFQYDTNILSRNSSPDSYKKESERFERSEIARQRHAKKIEKKELLSWDEDEISKLKRELKALLEEEESERCSKRQENLRRCCSCCPKERRKRDGTKAVDGDGSARRKSSGNNSPPCAGCDPHSGLTPPRRDGSAPHRDCPAPHRDCSAPHRDLSPPQRDRSARPLFYSSLYAAYQRLNNKRNKKPIWR